MVHAAAHEPRSFEPAQRLASVDADAVLLRLASAGLIERGCVTIIGLDALKAQLGERWEARRERVWEAVEQRLRQRLRPSDVYARIGEVDLLLACGDSREAALAVSLNILKELLAFFLGDRALSDRTAASLRLERVASAPGGGFRRQPVDPSTVRPAPVPRGAEAAPGPDWSALWLAASDGRELRIAFDFERLFSMRSLTGAAVRLRPVVHDARTGQPLGPAWRETLSFQDVLSIDLMVLDVLKPLRDAGKAHKVIAPLSLETLFSLRGRAGVIGRLSNADPSAGSAPILEILGVDGGTPKGRLAETVSVMKRCTRAVIARARLDRSCLKAMTGCQLSGVSADFADWPDEERRLLAGLWQFSKAAREIGSFRVAIGLPNAAACGLAATVGVTHASVRDAKADGRSPAKAATPAALKLADIGARPAIA